MIPNLRIHPGSVCQNIDAKVMTVYRGDRSFGDIKAVGRLRLAVFLPQYAETDGGGTRPIGEKMVAQVILDKFVIGLGVRLDIARQPTSHGAVDVLNSGVFDTIIFEINGGQEELNDPARMIVKNLNWTRDY